MWIIPSQGPVAQTFGLIYALSLAWEIGQSLGLVFHALCALPFVGSIDV